jgi:hypothetical protein
MLGAGKDVRERRAADLELRPRDTGNRSAPGVGREAEQPDAQTPSRSGVWALRGTRAT